MGIWSKPSEEEIRDELSVTPRFTRAGMLTAPKHRIPDDEMLPQTAFQIIRDEVMLDGNARSTWRRSSPHG